MRKLLIAILLSLIPALLADDGQTSEKPGVTQGREFVLAKAIEQLEQRHFDIHRNYIPLTQGNLQWLAATIHARPDEILVVWRLMRQWDGPRAMAARRR